MGTPVGTDVLLAAKSTADISPHLHQLRFHPILHGLISPFVFQRIESAAPVPQNAAPRPVLSNLSMTAENQSADGDCI